MELYYKYDKSVYTSRMIDLYEGYKKLDGSIVINEGKNDEFVLVPQISEGYFEITSLSRDDFEGRGYDTSKLSDTDMKYIAGKMADSYVENQFWIDIDYFADYYDLPKIEDEE